MLLVQKSIQSIGSEYTSYILILFANVLFKISSTIATENHKITPIYIGMIGGLSNVVLHYTITKKNNTQFIFKDPKDFKYLMIRHTITFIQGLVFLFCLKYLQAAIVFNISNTGPIIIFIIDHFKYGTPIRNRDIFGIILSFCGVAIVTNSNILQFYFFHQHITSKFQYVEVDIKIQMLIGIFFFFILFLWAWAILLIRQIKKTSVPQITLHSGLVALFLSSLLNFTVQNAQEITVFQNLQILFTVGMGFALTSLIYTKGIQMANNKGIASMLGFTNVILSYIVSMIRYNEYPNIFGIIGSCLIFIGLVGVIIK